MVDLRGPLAPDDKSVELRSETPGELLADAEVLTTTGDLKVARYTHLLDTLRVGSEASPANSILTGNLTVNGNATLAGYVELTDDLGNTTTSIQVGAIKIYVSTIGRPQLEENALAVSAATEGSLFINTVQRELYIYDGSNQWKQF